MVMSDKSMFLCIKLLGVGCILFAFIAGFLGGQIRTAIGYILLAIICISCGVLWERKNNDIFCPNCGKRLFVKEAKICKQCHVTLRSSIMSETKYISCTKCGGQSRAQDEFCSHCGVPLNETKFIKCIHCGSLNKEQNAFCSRCRSRLK